MAKQSPRVHFVLVTGASDGLGFILAKAYASRGHKVLATGRKPVKNDEDFFGQSGITYIRADQTEPKQAARNIANAMRELGWPQLDLAILNAGIGWTGQAEKERPSSIQKQISVNLTATVTIAKAVAPWLFSCQGKLAIVGSTSVAKAQPKFATYVATKAGLDGFARSLREEWRGRATVLMIHPGPTRTTMHKKAGLNVGMIRMFFMSPKRAAKCVQKAIRKNEHRPMLTRTYGWFAIFSRGKYGKL